MFAVLCLSYQGRDLFLRDFIESFKRCSRPDTLLVLGIQRPSNEMRAYLRGFVWADKDLNCVVKLFPENNGLNAYDDLVKLIPDDCTYFTDTDDDSVLFPGYESIFETVLQDVGVGWVGIPHTELEVQPFLDEDGNEHGWGIHGYHVLNAPVGGGLAATRRDVWERVGGFGIGRSLFDPEDARYQKKCIEAGYLTGMITNCPRYEHHGGWEWHIKYGTAQSKLDSLLEACKAGFISDEQYRLSCQAYLAAASEVKVEV